MGYKENYEELAENPYFDEATEMRNCELLREMKREIEERFYMDLEFGTGGLRGSDRSRYKPHEHLYRA